MYVNGQLVNTEFHPAGNTIVPLTAYSGMRIRYSRVNAGYFNGILDNVCLYNRGPERPGGDGHLYNSP